MNTFFVILILAIFIIDAYSFKGFRFFIENWSGHARIIFTIVFWSITLTIVALLLVLRNTFDGERDPAKFVTLYYFGGIILLIYLPKINFMIFHLMEDIIFAGSFLIKKLALVIAGLDIKTIRLAFLSKTGLILALVNFLLILYGMAWGRFDYRVREIELPFSSLPVEFDGLTIVQISDIHVGSFHGYKKQVERGVKIANEHNADITVFTGDLVNNFAEELDEFIDILKKIDGSWAKYSIMGNHDYGDYWE
ncbi:MAG: metallophosphoesterase, partial [Bacteroidota bacterium]